MNWESLKEKFTPNVIIDCGAHLGGFYRESRLIWPDAKYVLIEAQQACETALKETGMDYHIAVLSDRAKEVTFYNRKNNISTGASIYREDTQFFSDDQIEPEIRTTTTLDALLFGKEVRLPILLKIDAQGSELDILKGAEKFLPIVEALLLEVAIFPYNQGAPLYDKVEEYVKSKGFYPAAFVGIITHPLQPELVIQQDVLYLRK